jgi:L-asparaginase
MVSPEEMKALKEAVAAGLVVVQSSRGGSGRVPTTERLDEAGMIGADNLNPQKARILLSLALNRTRNVTEIRELFETC